MTVAVEIAVVRLVLLNAIAPPMNRSDNLLVVVNTLIVIYWVVSKAIQQHSDLDSYSLVWIRLALRPASTGSRLSDPFGHDGIVRPRHCRSSVEQPILEDLGDHPMLSFRCDPRSTPGGQLMSACLVA